MSSVKRTRLRFTRDSGLFLLGALGFLHELLLTHGERPTLIFACLALMGLPVFLRGDEKKKLPSEDDT